MVVCLKYICCWILLNSALVMLIIMCFINTFKTVILQGYIATIICGLCSKSVVPPPPHFWILTSSNLHSSGSGAGLENAIGSVILKSRPLIYEFPGWLVKCAFAVDTGHLYSPKEGFHLSLVWWTNQFIVICSSMDNSWAAILPKTPISISISCLTLIWYWLATQRKQIS